MIRAQPRSLLTVQALRAVAALLVVAYHALNLGSSKLTGSTASVWENGSAGVDIFFVISGLVMGLSTERLRYRSHPGLTFLRHRIIRIVPMYWLVTTAKIVAVLLLPQLVMRTELHWQYVLSSYALLPLHDAAGEFKPVLPVGWTLTYEMFFYLLVTVGLWLRAPILYVAGPVLGVVFFIAAARQPLWPAAADFANSIVLEFIYGLLISFMLRRDRLLPAGIATVSLLCGTLLIVTLPATGLLRPFVWGFPAAMMVIGAVSLESVRAQRIPRWLLASGDASYSIYLTHAFVLPAVWLVIMRLGASGETALVAMVGVSLVVSTVAGWLTYVTVERRIVRGFAGSRPRPVPMEATQQTD